MASMILVGVGILLLATAFKHERVRYLLGQGALGALLTAVAIT